MMLSNKFRAFTLLESLVVILLTTSFILLPVLQTKGLAKRFENNDFYTQINENLPKLQELCIQRRAEGKVINQGKSIVFSVKGQIEESLTIIVPDDIRVWFTASGDNGALIEEITFNKLGNNSSFPRIYFEDRYQSRTIIYVFQLYRGKFHVRYA